MSKNNLEDYVLSDKNIYIAIYSVKSYVFEPGLLSTDDKKLLNMLQDPFNEKIIFQVIKEVKNIIEKIIKDESNLFKVQVYFKPKKYEDGKEIFRPIHTADLKSLIAMAALLNVLIYDTSDDRIKLSNYSRLIPNNFYGNRVSDNPEQLYKKWNIQYKEYTQKANDYLKKYYESGEYKYEIKMDIKNFFPSVNPLLVYAMLLENMPVTLSKNDEKIFKTIIYKLLICKVTNINTKKAKKLYYDTFIDKNSYTRGLPQGLPQSYFFGNVCMTRIAQIVNDNFEGTEYAHKWKDADDNDIKKLILDIYKELDQFFEDRIRSNHAKNSAAEIRTRHELDFLEPSVRENIAKIAENHIADVKNVYFVKGDAQNSLISYKFDMILLRIADLLDMSERRISKPILNHNIDNMSKESAFHWISHLLTENYTLVSKYENGYAKDTDSYLAPGNMIERVELTIFVDMSQFSKIQTGGCRYCKIDENTISPYGFDIYMLNGESEVCDGKKCNFLCKWFNKKNDYLVQEMQALEQYLGRIPKNNKLYKTEIVIKVRVNNTSCIPKEQFEILREVIEEKKQ